MKRSDSPALPAYVRDSIAPSVRAALAEDVADGDITAGLIPADRQARATLITREPCVLCGRPWAEEVFRQLGGHVSLDWQADDGDALAADQVICELEGNARELLTGERNAMNFLQTLSGVATLARDYADAVAGKQITILDTRKTLPGLRAAQKYAVLTGGCHNHRIGLFDAFLIKENHISACGGISAAITRARELAPGKPLIVEVETLEELDEAIAAGPDQIMLDNFDDASRQAAYERAPAHIALELSGNISLDMLRAMPAQPRPVLVSSGALTKHVQAVDLSLRVMA